MKKRAVDNQTCGIIPEMFAITEEAHVVPVPLTLCGEGLLTSHQLLQLSVLLHDRVSHSLLNQRFPLTLHLLFHMSITFC